jgi:hypothetical protein
MKTIKIKIEDNKEFEIKVEKEDLSTLLKILWAFICRDINNCA